MRKASEEPLAKMTMKFYAADIEFLRNAHGWGYSTVVRDLVRAHVKAVKITQQQGPLAYPEDLEHFDD